MAARCQRDYVFVMSKTCKFEGCDKPTKTKGLCNGHYEQRRKGQKLTALIYVRPKGEPIPTCSFSGCPRLVRAKGLCAAHYKQKRSCMELQPLRARRCKGEDPKPCSFEGCNRLASVKELCASHYVQGKRRNGREMTPLRGYRLPNQVELDEDGVSCWLVLLDVHGESRSRTRIDLEDLDNVLQYRWQGSAGRATSRIGTKESRKHLVMARLILDAHEDLEVDHINGNPLDNRKKNLREVTHAENMQNQGVRANSTTGIRNVQLVKSGFYKGKFCARVMKGGKSYEVGYFGCIEEAEEAAEELRATLFTHHNEERSKLIEDNENERV